MKLYYFPAACSLSPHIVLREAGFSFSLEKVDLGTKRLADGRDYSAINPKGYVPALELDDGEVLTEGPAIVQYLADLKPESRLAPKSGTLARTRLQEALNYITAELHKPFAPLFNPETTPERRREIIAVLGERIGYLERQLDGMPFLMGEHFSAADAYLFTVLNWTRFVNMSMDAWPTLIAYMQRIRQRPAVRDALVAEGLAEA